MNRQFLAIIIFVLLGYAACKKKETVQPAPEPVNTSPVVPVDYEMLHITKPEWLIYKVDASGTDVWVIPGIISNCSKDDTYRFYKDSTLTCYENSNVCSGNPDSTLSDWQFINGRKKIVSTFLGTRDTADILLLTDTTMNLFVNYMGTDATVFFKKK